MTLLFFGMGVWLFCQASAILFIAAGEGWRW